MNQTIKQKIQAQICLNQELLNYDDSDSQECQFQGKRQNIVKLPSKYRKNQDQIRDHAQMNQKRKQLLKNLMNQEKEHLQSKKRKNQSSPFKVKNKQNISNQNMKMIESKSKLAQVLKQSQQKSNQIEKSKIQSLRFTNQIKILMQQKVSKQNLLLQKQDQIRRLKYYQAKITNQYQKRSEQLQDEHRKELQMLNNSYKHMTSTSHSNQQRLRQIQRLLNLKNQQVQKLRNRQKKSKRCLNQNQRLKQDVKRLIELTQQYEQQYNLLGGRNNVKGSKVNALKQNKSRAKSSLSEENLFVNTKDRTLLGVSKLIDCHYLSLPSKSTDNYSSWFPTGLISQVQSFLKKWHMGHNNGKFVNSLVQFINSYTQMCEQKNKYRMQNKYESLKKQIYRKANHSLAVGQILKYQELRRKVARGKRTKKSYSQFRETSQNCIPEDISVLVPASNKIHQNRKSHHLSPCLLNQKMLKKDDDTGYKNLQKSIRLHHQNSQSYIIQSSYQESMIKQKTCRLTRKYKEKRRNVLGKKVKTQFQVEIIKKNQVKQQKIHQIKKQLQETNTFKTQLF